MPSYTTGVVMRQVTNDWSVQTNFVALLMYHRKPEKIII